MLLFSRGPYHPWMNSSLLGGKKCFQQTVYFFPKGSIVRPEFIHLPIHVSPKFISALGLPRLARFGFFLEFVNALVQPGFAGFGL